MRNPPRSRPPETPPAWEYTPARHRPSPRPPPPARAATPARRADSRPTAPRGEPSVPVITHRMRRVIMAGRPRHVAGVKRDRAQQRVHRALGQHEQRGIPAFAPAPRADPPRGIAVDAPVQSDLRHARAPRRHGRTRPGPRQRRRHLRPRRRESSRQKIRVKHPRQVRLLRHEGRGRRAHKRRVVRVHAVPGHAVRRRSPRLDEPAAPRAMRSSERPRPLDRAHHDRRPGTAQPEPDGFQRIAPPSPA